jgi:hypothetical protein
VSEFGFGTTGLQSSDASDASIVPVVPSSVFKLVRDSLDSKALQRRLLQ